MYIPIRTHALHAYALRGFAKRRNLRFLRSAGRGKELGASRPARAQSSARERADAGAEGTPLETPGESFWEKGLSPKNGAAPQQK